MTLGPSYKERNKTSILRHLLFISYVLRVTCAFAN